MGVLSCLVVASIVGRTHWLGMIIGVGLVAAAGAGYLRRFTTATITRRMLAWTAATGALSVVVAASHIGRGRDGNHDAQEVAAAVGEKARDAHAAKHQGVEGTSPAALAGSARCGDRPRVSGWDGELAGAEIYLAQGAHDPDSIQVENCTEPVLTAEACWLTVCEVRGRNGFGALVYNRVAFSVGRDGILSAENVR